MSAPAAIEVNFDGLIGPTHNFAGLSPGNTASAAHAGGVAAPRAAASQGIAKMRALVVRGVRQGVLPPPRRPAVNVLRRLGFAGDDRAVLARAAAEDPRLFVDACSAAAMWAANAATVIAAPDSGDGRVHLVVANLATNLHRAMEADDRRALLERVFPDRRRFVVHPPLPLGAHFADEGAANHMRLCGDHGAPGFNVLVHGAAGPGRFPRRQTERASAAIARLTGARAMLVAQAEVAIDAGAFHNDVVAVANERVLLYHPAAFADGDVAAMLDRARAVVPDLVAVAAEGMTLADAVRTYVFNSQLVTLPGGAMALIVPRAAAKDAACGRLFARLVAVAPIAEVVPVDLDQSLANGGGPACLRLRVPVDAAGLAAINPLYLVDERRLDGLAAIVDRWWPERIGPGDLASPDLWDAADAAHGAVERWLSRG